MLRTLFCCGIVVENNGNNSCRERLTDALDREFVGSEPDGSAHRESTQSPAPLGIQPLPDEIRDLRKEGSPVTRYPEPHSSTARGRLVEALFLLWSVSMSSYVPYRTASYAAPVWSLRSRLMVLKARF